MANMGSLEALVARLEKVASILEGRVDGFGSGASVKAVSATEVSSKENGAGVSPSVSAYEELMSSKLGRVHTAAKQIGGSVNQATEVLCSAFKAEQDLVLMISQCKKPSTENLMKIVGPLGEAITKAQKLTEGKRTDAFNHQKVIAESVVALTWVVYTGKDCGLSLPGPHVEESWQSAEFYNNKVLMEFKAKDPNHVEWAKAMKELYVPGLRDYVKKFHTTGPAWNANGVEVSQFSTTQSKTPPAPPKGTPPPPPRAPPPPPPGSLTAAPAKPAGPASGMSAVFKEISKGEAVTSGLKKVTDDMKTKNRADRSGAVPAGGASEKGSPVATPKTVVKKPVFELQLGRKWAIENQVGNKNLVVENTSPQQSVYIFGCKDSIIQVKGKVNIITMDKCTKTAIVFGNVVAAFEVVNSSSVEVQCQGRAPTIAIDNTNGCHLYLSRESLGASITTAKSTEVNVAVPGATPEDDMVEHALPEQYVNVFQDGQFITSPVSHSGG